jgi:glycosyltransferase involved in cell wall biosynthesis
MIRKRPASVIYHFILDPRSGGPHNYVVRLSKALAAEFDSIVVTGGKSKFTDLPLLNLRHMLRVLYPLEVFLNVIKICWYFRKCVNHNNVVIDVHGAANVAPIIAARILKIPVVWHFHEIEKSFTILVSLGRRLLSKLPHSLVVVANKSKEVYSLPDACFIPGAVDLDFWKTSEPLSSDSKVLKLLAVGNINPLKGFDVFLEALVGIDIPVKVVLAGATLNNFGRYTATLMKQANKLKKLNCDVEFAGWQSSDSVRNLMSECDIFVLPSLSEACPLVLLEAMACRCACIATDVGDVAEIMSAKDDGGLLVESGDSARLRDSLRKLYFIGGEARLKMGNIARETVEARYGLGPMALKHHALYDALLNRSEAKP